MASKEKPTEDEVQEWLDTVHFSSCCSDPLVSSDNKSKAQLLDEESSKKSHNEPVAKSQS